MVFSCYKKLGQFLGLCFSWLCQFRDFVECASTWVCLMFLSWPDRVMDFWEEYCTGEVAFLLHLIGVPDSDFIITGEVDLAPLPQVLSARQPPFNIPLLWPTIHTVTLSSHSGQRKIPFLNLTYVSQENIRENLIQPRKQLNVVPSPGMRRSSALSLMIESWERRLCLL